MPQKEDHAYSLPHMDQLLDWVEKGQLSQAQLRRATAARGATPSPDQWFVALDRLLGFYGVLLLGLGVIFFFAWNWEDLHRFIRLGLAAGALSAFAGLALLATPGSVLYRSAMFGAALATGGLLALIGQVYQTGADPWQLFAIWALLILPWALLSRSAASWGLWWLVGNLALLRYFHSTGFGILGGPDGEYSLLSLALFNGLVLLVFELGESRLLHQSRRHLQRLAGLGILLALGVGSAMAWWEASLVPVLLSMLGVCVLGVPLYWRARRDLLLLALQLFALVGVLTAGLGRLLEDSGEYMLLNTLGLFLLFGSALVSMLLRRLHREGLR